METLDMAMHVTVEPMRGERSSPDGTIPADEACAGWELVGRAVLAPSIPQSRTIHALVFRAAAGEHYAVFLDKNTFQFRALRLDKKGPGPVCAPDVA